VEHYVRPDEPEDAVVITEASSPHPLRRILRALAHLLDDRPDSGRRSPLLIRNADGSGHVVSSGGDQSGGGGA